MSFKHIPFWNFHMLFASPSLSMTHCSNVVDLTIMFIFSSSIFWYLVMIISNFMICGWHSFPQTLTSWNLFYHCWIWACISSIWFNSIFRDFTIDFNYINFIRSASVSFWGRFASSLTLYNSFTKFSTFFWLVFNSTKCLHWSLTMLSAPRLSLKLRMLKENMWRQARDPRGRYF